MSGEKTSELSLFERIAQGDIPSVKVRENEEFLAILDIFPNCTGQTLVFPKKRYDSDVMLMPDDVYQRYMQAVKEVSILLKRALHVQRVGMIIEGMGVNHAHTKLYPMHGLDEEWQAVVSPETARYEIYP